MHKRTLPRLFDDNYEKINLLLKKKDVYTYRNAENEKYVRKNIACWTYFRFYLRSHKNLRTDRPILHHCTIQPIFSPFSTREVSSTREMFT